MSDIRVPITGLPTATLPLDGSELLPLVQNGQTVKVTLLNAGLGPITKLGAELLFVSAAGNNNNVALGNFNRLLVDTTAGDATITGIAAGTDGQLCVVTNQGPNLLTLADSNAASLAANRLYGVTDITSPPKGSMLLSYSATLLKWVMV